MPKYFALLLACLACTFARATEIGTSGSEQMMRHAEGRAKQMNREQLTREIDETMLIIEDLCHQAKLAPKAEVDDVWASGSRDYKLEKAEVNDARKACEATQQALDLESNIGGGAADENAAKAKDLRETARDLMRPHHKKQSEEYVRDLRNWLTISEGMLRHANEKREREAKPK